MKYKKLGLGVAVLLLVGLPLKQWHLRELKGRIWPKLEAHWIGSCAQDATCLGAVATHLKGCFEKSFRRPGQKPRLPRYDDGLTMQCMAQNGLKSPATPFDPSI
jgi:hypothetical protein